MDEGVERAIRVLDDGGVLVLPTDTVYGLAARADRPAAIERMYELKGRPQTKPFQVLVAGIEDVGAMAAVNDGARSVAARFWPGPLTMILAALPPAPALLVSDGGIGLRAP